ncbi:MAG: Ig-like domain-containing protein, partial [Bacteroidales bacterium]|nr:Ig-like domain-containing protein [Bacteroidales bacterium]
TDKTIQWSSNKTSVATVSNGKVTAVGAGTATITAKNNASGVTGTCKIKESINTDGGDRSTAEE